MKAFGGLVVVILLILGAYYLGKNSSSTGQLVAEERVSPTPSGLISSPTPIKTVTVTTAPVVTKLLSTNGWVTADNGIFSIKYPAETFRPIIGKNYIQLQWKNNTGSLMVNSPDLWIADNYAGGSRREWYLNYYSFYANEVVFTEKSLGKIGALEAKPKSGKVTTDILVTNGKTLIDVVLQGADLNLVETIASTIEFK
jgi:hypothetical protein